MLTWTDPIESDDYYLRNAVAFDPETKAVLHVSRKQWTLLAGEDYSVTRHWQRAKVSKDEILAKAQKSLDRLKDPLIGKKVQITRNETWQGDICTVTRKSEPDMYWLSDHGWRKRSEFEIVS